MWNTCGKEGPTEWEDSLSPGRHRRTSVRMECVCSKKGKQQANGQRTERFVNAEMRSQIVPDKGVLEVSLRNSNRRV